MHKITSAACEIIKHRIIQRKDLVTGRRANVRCDGNAKDEAAAPANSQDSPLGRSRVRARGSRVYTDVGLVAGVATGHGGAAPPARSSVRHGVARGTHCFRRLAVPTFVRRDARKPHGAFRSSHLTNEKKKVETIVISSSVHAIPRNLSVRCHVAE